MQRQQNPDLLQGKGGGQYGEAAPEEPEHQGAAPAGLAVLQAQCGGPGLRQLCLHLHPHPATQLPSLLTSSQNC